MSETARRIEDLHKRWKPAEGEAIGRTKPQTTLTTAEAQVVATMAVAEALDSIAYALRCLGTGNAATPMGAVEMLALEVRNGLSGIAEAVQEHTRQVGE